MRLPLGSCMNTSEIWNKSRRQWAGCTSHFTRWKNSINLFGGIVCGICFKIYLLRGKFWFIYGKCYMMWQCVQIIIHGYSIKPSGFTCPSFGRNSGSTLRILNFTENQTCCMYILSPYKAIMLLLVHWDLNITLLHTMLFPIQCCFFLNLKWLSKNHRGARQT